MKAQILNRNVIHSGFVTLSRNKILSGDVTIEREIVSQQNAAAVLPYDQQRGVATFVQLLRAPVLACGAADLLETPAGVVDEDEEACDAARREVYEETGLALADLEEVGSFWSSPGISTERVTLFLAAYSPADRKGPGGGLPEENENVTVVELPLANFPDDRVRDLKTLALIQALKLRRPHLFAPQDHRSAPVQAPTTSTSES